jgi:toxin ParE1/3/4
VIYRLSAQARQDLLHIWNYIAEDSEPAADRFIDLLIHHFELLGNNPHAGRRRDELRTGYRSFPVGQYVIFFRFMDDGIQIMRVIHGKRDIGSLFET